MQPPATLIEKVRLVVARLKRDRDSYPYPLDTSGVWCGLNNRIAKAEELIFQLFRRDMAHSIIGGNNR
jgi:hypothetical protein